MRIAGGLDVLARRPGWLLAAVLSWHIALWWAAQADVSWSDPLGYAERAQEIARGWDVFLGHPSTHPFSMRLGIVVPVGMMYRWFGVSVATTNVWSLAAVLLIVAVTCAAMPTRRGRAIALLLAASSAPLAVNGFDLTADLVSAAFLALGVEALTRRDQHRGSAWIAGAVLAWFAAFLAKESAIWLAPAWLYVVVVDLRRHGVARTWRRYAPAVAVAVCTAAAYLWLCDRYWGHPLARWRGIRAVSVHHLWTLDGTSAAAWARRLTFGPAHLLVRAHGPVLLAAACAPWCVPERLRVWMVATAGILAFYWFGSASTSTYMPLPLIGRMVLPALPGIIVLAAASLDAWIARWPARPPGHAVGVVVIGAVLVVAWFARAVVPMVARDAPDARAMAVAREVVADRDGPLILVCGDERTASIARFHFGYRPPPAVTIVEAATFAAAPAPTGARVIVLLHPVRARFVERTYGVVTGAAVIEGLGLPRLYARRDMEIQDAADGHALHHALQ